MVSPFLFFADERLSLAELTAACLDGILVPLGEGFMPADAAETAWMRGRSLAPLLGDRWGAVRASAAWVHGAVSAEPARHHVQRVSPTRQRALSDGRTVYHDVRLPLGDTVVVGGVPVSTPARTLVDLARADSAEERRIAWRWAVDDRRTRRAAAVWLERHPRFPYGRRAAELLSAVDAGRTVGPEGLRTT